MNLFLIIRIYLNILQMRVQSRTVRESTINDVVYGRVRTVLYSGVSYGTPEYRNEARRNAAWH
jgi:hypothetical protein